jgi:hypothetical protein
MCSMTTLGGEKGELLPYTHLVGFSGGQDFTCCGEGLHTFTF